MTPATFVGSYPAADFSLVPPGPEVALVGRSNVGKSSLLNALAGRRRLAHTSHTPGRTRACNVYRLDGAYLIDLPGYGYAALSRASRAALARLVQAYFAERAPAGAVWLLDIRREPSREDVAMGGVLARRQVPALVALTKIDKLGRGDRRHRREAIRNLLGVDVPEDRCVFTSSRTGEGIAELREAIERLVTGGTGGRADRRTGGRT